MLTRSFPFFFFISWTLALPLPLLVSNTPSRKVQPKSYEIPIQQFSSSTGGLERRGGHAGSAGLRDLSDFLYFVSMTLGNSSTDMILDTGSSDLWVMSDKCATDTCTSGTSTSYSSQSANFTNATVDLRFGDSTTGTHASGPIVLDTVSVAGLSMDAQPFVAVNDTDNSAVQNGGSGLFGLGFPSQSFVQAAVVNEKFDTPKTTDAFIADSATDGPLISRMVLSGQLEEPIFAITFQRDSLGSDGKEGTLTVGSLPQGVKSSSLTWVPVRLYAPEDGGQHPPEFAPDEVYPLRWEVPLDGVYMDGQRLPDTNSTGDGIKSKGLSALIDSGNSLCRGPQDVVDFVLKMLSPAFGEEPSATPSFPCDTPHTLAFQIGGKMFPVDPRDFVAPYQPSSARQCAVQNLVATDAPRIGSLFTWSLGAPFFRSNVVAFYFGNLTHPSVDPPRIGFLNTVPPNADELLRQAVLTTAETQTDITLSSERAPSATTTINIPATTISVPRPAGSDAAFIVASTTASSGTWRSVSAPYCNLYRIFAGFTMVFALVSIAV